MSKITTTFVILAFAALGAAALAVNGAYPGQQNASPGAQQSILFDRVGGVPMTPDRSVPAESLRSESTRTVVREGGVRLGDYGYGNGFNTIDNGQWAGSDSRMPGIHNGMRRNFAEPRFAYRTPVIVDQEKTVVQPQTEYNVYSLGNVVKVDRVYTTKERTIEEPAAVYDVYGWRGNGLFHHHALVLNDSRTVKETETSVQTIAAERSTLPHTNMVRMIGIDGQVYLVPAQELAPKPAPSVNETENQAAPLWMPERLD